MMFILLFTLLFQTSGLTDDIILTVQLVDAQNQPLEGQQVQLVEPHAETTFASCTTDQAGFCQWSVESHHIYQIVIEGVSTDAITTAALGHGGLRENGLGIMMGTKDYTAKLFIQEEHLYFADKQTASQPFVPQAEDREPHLEPTPIGQLQYMPIPPDLAATAIPKASPEAASIRQARFAVWVLYLVVGIIFVGVMWYLWPKDRED